MFGFMMCFYMCQSCGKRMIRVIPVQFNIERSFPNEDESSVFVTDVEGLFSVKKVCVSDG